MKCEGDHLAFAVKIFCRSALTKVASFILHVPKIQVGTRPRC
jgi:hypothetical protein